MSKGTKDFRPPVAERVTRQAGSLDDGGASRPSRLPEEELATRASRYRRIAALLEEWRTEDEACDSPALDSIEPLRLGIPEL